MTRSILKKTSTPPTQPAPRQDERIRETALYHANLIQHRKDVESQIFNAIEELLELPSSASADPRYPSEAEAATVASSMSLFQPKDHDALIEERNINRQCGYVLCPQPNRQQHTNAKYRMIRSPGSGTKGPEIVETRALEKWCSENCGRRAAYISAQLRDEPAWTRNTGTNTNISILQKQEATLSSDMRDRKIGSDEDELLAKLKALAVERGDVQTPGKSSGLLRVAGKNSSTTGAPKSQAPTLYGKESIEGYQPRFQRGKLRDQQSQAEPDDVMSTI